MTGFIQLISRKIIPLVLLVCLATTASPLAAEVSLPKLFGDNMVLQRGKPLPVWGKAAAGEKVTVTLDGKQASAVAGKDGRWQVKLSAHDAGGPFELRIAGENTVTLKNVLVGEVWVCSGQSNMEWPMTRINHSKEEIAAAKHPKIRLFHVQRRRSAKPVDDVNAAWRECSPETVSGFSAVGYFFGRHLQENLDVPVGLIESAWGGTPAEHWTTAESFASDPSLLKTSDHPHAVNVMKGRSSLYNGMIAPLVPYAIQGVIWYQGESNVPMGKYYHKLFPGMIQGWRKAWGQGDFPFLYVQIAPWRYDRIKGWPRSGCPLVQEAQLKTLALKNTGMAVTMDIGNVNDIHPRNKQDVGKRLGLAARKIAYGEDLIYSGPIYKSHKVTGDKIVIQFDHLGGGLVCRGDKLTHFQIAGKDRKFVEASATIEDDTIVVQSDDVSEPMAVRFAFEDIAQPNLANKAGLPASPFRTDDWE